MKRRAATLAAALGATLAVGPGSASADHGDRITCNAANTWCVAVFHKVPDFAAWLDFTAKDLKGRYRLCVTPPRGQRTCRSFRLKPRPGDGVGHSSVKFTKNFPHSQHGRYTARWFHHGRQIGPALPFRY